MARSITVYREVDAEFLAHSPELGSPAFDAWEEEANRRCVFNYPLGSEDAIRRYWSEPARALGLDLIAALYDSGFYEPAVFRGASLDLLESELQQLEPYWAELIADAEREDLSDRASHLREAVRAARACAGYVCIS